MLKPVVLKKLRGASNRDRTNDPLVEKPQLLMCSDWKLKWRVFIFATFLVVISNAVSKISFGFRFIYYLLKFDSNIVNKRTIQTRYTIMIIICI